jgi:SAM-dependent methyltransferase
MARDQTMASAAESQVARSSAGKAFQLEAAGPDEYERYLVPAFFAPCAELVVEAAGIVPSSNVLDVACGTGVVARAAALRVGPSGSVVGADLNDGMIATARAVARDVQPPIEWIVAAAEDLPLVDDRFDVVLCQQGLQFFADGAEALRQMRRVLKPGGRLVLAVWRPIGHNPVFDRFVEVLDRRTGPSTGDILRAPFSGPPVGELRALLERAGFAGPQATIGIITVRFPSADEFIRREVNGSPLRGPIGALAASETAALLEDLRTSLEPWSDDAGLVYPMETWIVVARG